MQFNTIRAQIIKAEQEDTKLQEITRIVKEDREKRIKVIENKLKKKQTKGKRHQLKGQLKNIQAEKDITEKDRAFYAVRKIAHLYPKSPKSPEGALMLEILKGAINDLFSGSPQIMKNAAYYLNSNMVHALLCDIEPEWIRKELERAHVHVNARRLK